jgi:hypothetical protein
VFEKFSDEVRKVMSLADVEDPEAAGVSTCSCESFLEML